MTRRKGVEFFVSTEGNDDGAGAPKDPFASLERARDAIRELKRAGGLPPGGVTVWVRGGDYVREGTFELTQEDSGTEDAPIVYRASEGEEVRLLGGRVLGNFEPVTDPAVLDRLNKKARKHIVQADLKAHGITDFGRLRSRGFGRRGVPAHMELFFGGQPMTLARWPNDDFVKIAAIPEDGRKNDNHGQEMGGLEAGFFYEGDRPKRWKSTANVWLHGYWAYDWANSYEEIGSIDLESRLIKTKPPHGNYAFCVGQRFYFLNILEELDAAGEYYVDTKKGVLYFWPPAPAKGTEALVSVLEEPMVSMQDVSHVTLRGLTLEGARTDGIHIKGGAGNLVAGCTLCNLGNNAVIIEGGTRHGVVACDIYGVGDGGIDLSGGDRKTLAPCGHCARNNHIHHFSRWSRCYCPAVHFTGVGIHVAHNLIHDAPHTGILYRANESVIEFNEIYNVTLETGDCGAIYTGRDYTARGNIIRHNYIHDTGGYGMGSMAVYLDDCVSGQTIRGNIFVRTTRAVFIGGGRDVLVENNIFIDCVPAVDVDGRGLDDKPVWHNMVYKTMKKLLEEINHHQPPYSERYPELMELDKYYAADDGIPPEGNVIARNVCVGGEWLSIRWNAEEKHVTVGENLVDVDPHFVDAEADDYRLKDDSPAWKIGFKPIPVEKIGLEQDEYRNMR